MRFRVRQLELDDPVMPEVLELDNRPGLGVGTEAAPSADTDWWALEMLGFVFSSSDLPVWELVGYAGGRVIPETGAYYLSRAMVLPEYRGRGLQKRLIRARVAHARRLGCPRVVTYTNPVNVASNNSLIACGFKTASPWDGDKNSLWVHWSRKL